MSKNYCELSLIKCVVVYTLITFCSLLVTLLIYYIINKVNEHLPLLSYHYPIQDIKYYQNTWRYFSVQDISSSVLYSESKRFDAISYFHYIRISKNFVCIDEV